jgi:outer membrane protein assembly factor BamA
VRFFFTLLLLVVAMLAETRSQQTPASVLRLGDIQVTGAQRYSAADVTRLSGLDTKKPVTVADLAAAAERMAATGLFNSVKYRYATANGVIRLTFDIEEAAWTMPVVFDNFVWLTDADITAAVRQEIPSFDGTLPTTASDFARRVLQHLLEVRRISGRVEFLPENDLRTRTQRFLFSVKDPGPKVCSATVDGASPRWTREFGDLLRALVGGDYSRVYLTQLSNGTMLNMYRQQGHWRATFGPPSARLDNAAGCEGVAVKIPVDEGISYVWNQAEWIGNARLTPADLDKLLAMKRGDVASSATIDAGLRQVRAGYGKQGHVLAAAGYDSPVLDDDTRRATFQIRIVEGPQFRAGAIEFVGLPPVDASSLQARWRLRSGDIYDASYPDQFMYTEIVPYRRRTAPSAAPAVLQTHVDAQKLTVDVRFVFR